MDYKQTPEEFTHAPNEFSSDFIVETERADTTEMPLIPSISEETGVDPQSEQSASDDRYNNYGEYHSGNNTESAEDQDVDDDDYYTETADDDYYGDAPDAEYYDPSDEQAATIDDKFSSYTDYACAKCKLDDYEIISDVLGSEKEIVKLYSTALCEAAEENFRLILRENLDYAAEDQYKAFEFMQSRGMYKTEQASDNDLSQTKQQLSPLCDNTVNNNSHCTCENCYCDSAVHNCNNGDCDI